MIFDNYEISLWTHNDQFIAILGASGAYYLSEAYKPSYNYKTDGEEILSFTIPIKYIIREPDALANFDLESIINTALNNNNTGPAVNCYLSNGEFISISPNIIINDQGYAVINNSRWYSTLTSNSLLANEKRVKLIFDKGTANERVKEFVISDLVVERDGDNIFCNVECGGLAFYELGKVGYNITFNNDIIDLEEKERGDNNPIFPTLNYWMDKVFPAAENDSRNNWSYSIQMDYKEIFNNASSTKIYEEPGIISWHGDGVDEEFTPVYRTELAEKCRNPSIEKSNKYNICQDLAELFGVYVRVEYEHKDSINPYKITNRKVIFYNKPYHDTEYSISYGNNETSISKTSSSKDLVTKMYVEDIESEYSNSGLLSISESSSNRSKENFILNFDYYRQAGMLNQSQIDAIDGNRDKGIIAFEEQLRIKNLILEQKFRLKYGYENDKLDLDVSIKNANEVSKEALKLAEELEEKLDALDDAVGGPLLQTKVGWFISGTNDARYISFNKAGILNDTEFKVYKKIGDAYTLLTKGTDYTITPRFEGDTEQIIGIANIKVAAVPITTTSLFISYHYLLLDEKLAYTMLGAENKRYINFRKNGILNNTNFAVYRKNDDNVATLLSPSYYTLVFNSYGNITGISDILLTGVPSHVNYLYFTYQFDIFSYYTNQLLTYIDISDTNTLLISEELQPALDTLVATIEAVEEEIQTLLDEKKAIILNFDNMMGFFLREGSWSNANYLAPSQPITCATVGFDDGADNFGCHLYYDEEAKPREAKTWYLSGIETAYYEYIEFPPFIPFTDIENLKLTERVIASRAAVKDFVNGAHFQVHFCKFTTGTPLVRPVMVIRKSIHVGNNNGLYYMDHGTQLEVKTFTANEQIVFRRIKSPDTKLLSLSLQLTVGTTELKEFEDYSIYTDLDANTIITLKINNNLPPDLTTIKVHYDSDRTVEQLYWDALDVSKRSAFPDAQYEVGFAYLQKSLSDKYIYKEYSNTTQYATNDIVFYNNLTYTAILPSLGNLPTNGSYWRRIIADKSTSRSIYQSLSANLNDAIELNLASVVRINDYELEMYGVKGIITEITLNLEEPDQNSFIVQNYKTRFEDIFQRIVASSEQMAARGMSYERAASAITPIGSILGDVLQTAVNYNNIVFSSGIKSNVSWGEDGILIENITPYPNGVKGQVVLKGGGIFLSNRMNDAGTTRVYTAAITPDGINASVLTAGRLDTERINIYSGNQLRFLWNGYGLLAYKSQFNGDTDFNNYVKYNEDGLSLIKKTGEVELKRVEVSWDGFLLRNNENTVVFDADPDTGDLMITGTITATAGNIGDWIIDAGYLRNNTDVMTQIVGLAAPKTNDAIALWAGQSYGSRASAPLRILTNGKLYATDVYLTGEITATTGYIGGTNGWIIDTYRLYSGTNTSYVELNSNSGQTFALWAGGETAASAPFSISKAGVLKATGGVIAGSMTVSGSLGTPQFASGALGIGWKIDGSGDATFNNVFVRGEIAASVFTYEQISSVGGQVYIAPTLIFLLASTPVAVVNSKYQITIPQNFTSQTIGGRTWTTNDIISLNGFITINSVSYELRDVRCRISSMSVSGIVLNTLSDAVNLACYNAAGVQQAYGTGENKVIWTNGIVSYDAKGVYLGTKDINNNLLRKGILLTTVGQNTPFIDIYDDTQVAGMPKVRLGELSGITNADYFGPDSLSGYGLYSENAYLIGTINATSGSIGDINNKWIIGSTGNGIDTVSSIYNGKDSLTTEGNGVYLGTDGISLGDGFKVYRSGDFSFGNNAITYNKSLDELRISADYISIGTDSITDLINNITIGTTNVLFGTKVEEWVNYSNATVTYRAGPRTLIGKAQSTNNTTGIFAMQQISSHRVATLYANQQYICSFLVRGNISTLNYLYLMNTGTTNQNIPSIIIPSSTVFTKVSSIFTANSYADLSQGSYIMAGYNGVKTADSWFEIQELKVELGNKATDWSPSQEDIDLAIGAKNTTYSGTYAEMMAKTGMITGDSWLVTGGGEKTGYTYIYNGSIWIPNAAISGTKFILDANAGTITLTAGNALTLTTDGVFEILGTAGIKIGTSSKLSVASGAGIDVLSGGAVTITSSGTGKGLTLKNASGTTVFETDSNGNLLMTGNITANAGVIGGSGGWTIGTKKLYSGSADTRVELNSDSAETYAIWAGAEVAANAEFRVSKAGVLTASSSNIGMFTINSSGLIDTANSGARVQLYPNYLKLYNHFQIDAPTATTANITGRNINIYSKNDDSSANIALKVYDDLWVNDNISAISFTRRGTSNYNVIDEGNYGTILGTPTGRSNMGVVASGDVAEAGTASTIVKRDAQADIACRLLRPNYADQVTISGGIAFRVNNSTDNYVRFCTDAAAIRAFIGCAATGHTHTKANITDFPTSIPASDVYAWAKAATKPSYTYSEVGSQKPIGTGTSLPGSGTTGDIFIKY